MKIILNLWLLFALGVAASPQAMTPGQALARIGNQAIYEEDLLPSIGVQLFKVKEYEYELRKKAIDDLVDQRLLQQEAKGTGLSVEAFLAERVKQKISPPTDRDVQAYYRDHQDPLGRSFNQVKAQMEENVMRLRIQQARQDYISSLRNKAGVEILYTRPKVEIRPDPLRTRGEPDARVTILEFADFECPYSQQAEPILNRVMDEYKGSVRFAFLDFPLKAIHPYAERVAEASRCAGEQEKFWEYHDRILTSSRLDPDALQLLARDLNLNLNEFRACLDSGKFAPSISADMLAGYRSGVSSTPTFYINGVRLVGFQPASEFKKVIDAELTARSSKAP